MSKIKADYTGGVDSCMVGKEIQRWTMPLMRTGSTFYDALKIAAVLVGTMTFAGGDTRSAIAQEPDAIKPPLADLMTLTQLRHFKLWYAQRVGNWTLATYELRQFEQTIRRVAQLYPSTSSIAQSELIREKTDPAMADLRQSLADKNAARFENAYVRLTNACNECHRAADVSFIVVQTPKRSPFSNQRFEVSR